jgi:hypothetical protein
MADDKTTKTDEQVEPVPASEVDEETLAPEAPQVISQEGALVGDENQPEPREVEVYVNKDAVGAQVAPEREAPAEQVPVHEVQVTLDEVILDPSSPEAVQVPDAGRGFLDLPIHNLAKGTPEQRFEDGTADEATDPGSLTPPTNE